VTCAPTPSASAVKLEEVVDEGKPWEVPDGLSERIEPLLPKTPRRFRYPGRKPLDDRKVFQGILFVLHTGIGWEHLPQQAGAWEKLHELLLAELHAGDQLEWEHAVADSSHLQAKKGAPRQVRARSTGAVAAASTTCS
jgi:transposase